MSAIPVIKELSHLPIVLDPSHAAGTWKYVEPLAKGAIATGADGLIIEVHSQPDCALCDGQQSLIPSRFEQLMKDLEPIALAVEENYCKTAIKLNFHKCNKTNIKTFTTQNNKIKKLVRQKLDVFRANLLSFTLNFSFIISFLYFIILFTCLNKYLR